MRKSVKTKRLHLSSETLRQLDQANLVQAAAGVPTNTTVCLYTACITSCNGCNTLNTCTSRYC